MRWAISRAAAPRWERAFFSCGLSSAEVRPASGTQRSGS